MQVLRGRGAPTHSLLLYYMGMNGKRHSPAALYPRERTPGTHWIGGWVGLCAGLDTEARGKILCLCRGLNPGRPICSQALELH
jgi:hypothetical protein